jgi:isochorismate hydrolase
VFAVDAISAFSAEQHAATITKIFPRIGLVKKTEEILKALQHA